MMETHVHHLGQFPYLFFFCDAYVHDAYDVDGLIFQMGHVAQCTQLYGLSERKTKG